MKKHKHLSNKVEYCKHHIAHQVFGQRDPKFTLIRGGVLPAAPLGRTVSEAPTPIWAELGCSLRTTQLTQRKRERFHVSIYAIRSPTLWFSGS